MDKQPQPISLQKLKGQIPIQQISFVGTPHNNTISSVQFSRDGQKFLTSSHDRTIKIWDLKTMACLSTIETSHILLTALFSADSKQVISGSFNGYINIWDIRTGQSIHQFLHSYIDINCLVLSSSGVKLAAGLQDSKVKVYDLNTRKGMSTLNGHIESVLSLAFSRDDTMLASGCDKYTIKVWSFSAKSYIATLQGHKSGVCTLAFSPKSNQLASGSKDSTIRLWDISTKSVLSIFNSNTTGHISSVAYSPDGTHLMSGNTDSVISIRNLSTKKIVHTIKSHSGEVNSVAYSLDGSCIVSGGKDKVVRLYDFGTKQSITIPKNTFVDSQNFIKISPDGKRAYTLAQNEKGINVWDIEEGRIVETVQTNSGIKLIDSLENTESISSNFEKKFFSQNSNNKKDYTQKEQSNSTFNEKINIKFLHNREQLVYVTYQQIKQFKLFSEDIISSKKAQSRLGQNFSLFNKGRFFAISTNQLELYDSKNFHRIKLIKGSNFAPIISFIISKCNQYGITLDKKSNLQIWCLKTSRCLSKRIVQSQSMLAIDKSIGIFMTGSKRQQGIQLWKIQTPQFIFNNQVPGNREKGIDINNGVLGICSSRGLEFFKLK